MIRARTRAECSERFDLVYSKDPALVGADAQILTRYRETWDATEIFDLVYAKADVPPEREPTRFRCRLLTASEALSCGGQPNVTLRHWYAFRYGFEAVRALGGEEAWAPDFDSEGQPGQSLKGPSASDLAERVGMDVVLEVGRAILARTHMMVAP